MEDIFITEFFHLDENLKNLEFLIQLLIMIVHFLLIYFDLKLIKLQNFKVLMKE